MASITHGPSCRCASCRAARAVSQVPQPGRPSETFLAPATPEKEILDDVQQAIQNDPVGTVVSFIIDDVDRSEILRTLTLSVELMKTRHPTSSRRQRGFTLRVEIPTWPKGVSVVSF